MKIALLLVFVIACLFAHGQHEVNQPFDSKIIAYYGIGFYIPKVDNQVVVSSHELRIVEDSTHFIIRWGKRDDNYLILGTLLDNDTINRQRFEFEFIPTEKGRLRWACQQGSELPGQITLHKDSLEQLKEFYLDTYRTYSPPIEWEIHKAEVHYTGLQSRPPSFEGSTTLPDAVIDSLKTLGNFFELSMILTVSMQDEIRRKIVEHSTVTLLEGETYERYIDPLYDYKRYVDTVLISQAQLESSDTIHLSHYGHLYIGFPRMKKDYEINLDDGICHQAFGDEYTEVKRGKGHLIYDAHTSEGAHALHFRSEGEKKDQVVIIKKRQKKID